MTSREKRWESAAVQGELEIDSHMSVSAGILAERGRVNLFQQTIDWRRTQPTASRQMLVGSGFVNFGKGTSSIDP
jgi:hypothetical protein